jgi:hypothetical protein
MHSKTRFATFRQSILWWWWPFPNAVLGLKTLSERSYPTFTADHDFRCVRWSSDHVNTFDAMNPSTFGIYRPNRSQEPLGGGYVNYLYVSTSDCAHHRVLIVRMEVCNNSLLWWCNPRVSRDAYSPSGTETGSSHAPGLRHFEIFREWFHIHEVRQVVSMTAFIDTMVENHSL